ncbi:hypothetical protein VP01_603g4 [Puccinia sorghi]|uniref:Uncharacterized protein n=1 Tax=Puccinia sorghi TaxID=27349 RepID=A0A0L6UHD1_9BASI|nr:hypothetical protein VP01_603g4 [Puccinia sorghi]
MAFRAYLPLVKNYLLWVWELQSRVKDVKKRDPSSRVFFFILVTIQSQTFFISCIQWEKIPNPLLLIYSPKSINSCVDVIKYAPSKLENLKNFCHPNSLEIGMEQIPAGIRRSPIIQPNMHLTSSYLKECFPKGFIKGDYNRYGGIDVLKFSRNTWDEEVRFGTGIILTEVGNIPVSEIMLLQKTKKDFYIMCKTVVERKTICSIVKLRVLLFIFQVIFERDSEFSALTPPRFPLPLSSRKPSNFHFLQHHPNLTSPVSVSLLRPPAMQNPDPLAPQPSRFAPEAPSKLDSSATDKSKGSLQKFLKILSFVYFGPPQLPTCTIPSVAAISETRSYHLAYKDSTPFHLLTFSVLLEEEYILGVLDSLIHTMLHDSIRVFNTQPTLFASTTHRMFWCLSGAGPICMQMGVADNLIPNPHLCTTTHLGQRRNIQWVVDAKRVGCVLNPLPLLKRILICGTQSSGVHIAACLHKVAQFYDICINFPNVNQAIVHKYLQLYFFSSMNLFFLKFEQLLESTSSTDVRKPAWFHVICALASRQEYVMWSKVPVYCHIDAGEDEPQETQKMDLKQEVETRDRQREITKKKNKPQGKPLEKLKRRQKQNSKKIGRNEIKKFWTLRRRKDQREN